jgi:hypothetical protein
MKSIANQYRDLKEGRMSEANFMRSLRMTMPQFVTNVTSFGDAVKILKNKSIIVETTVKENFDFDMAEGEGDEDAMYDAMIKKIEDELASMEATNAQYDENIDKEFDEEEDEKEMYDAEYDEDEMFNPAYMNEAKKPNVEKDEDENLEEVTLGIFMEHACFPEKSYEEIEKIVKKNIKKNPNYYTNYKLTGIRDYELQTMDSSKPEDHQMKFYTEKTAVDTARGMQKIKMPKADKKKKIKEGVDEAMPFADLPADPKKYKIVRDSKNYIIKATNADGVEFQKGDTVKTYDGEEIKIAKFEESQGKIKAIYNKGMFFAGIDIDGLEAPKPTMRPGVDMGASFEKMKKSMQEIVHETISEYFDGRDNLINPLSAEDENN